MQTRVCCKRFAASSSSDAIAWHSQQGKVGKGRQEIVLAFQLLLRALLPVLPSAVAAVQSTQKGLSKRLPCALLPSYLPYSSSSSGWPV